MTSVSFAIETTLLGFHLAQAPPDSRRAVYWLFVASAGMLALQVWDVSGRSGPPVTLELLSVVACVPGVMLLGLTTALTAGGAAAAPEEQEHITPVLQTLPRALQARMQPHFLFNALNTVAELVRSDPAAAEATVEDLSAILRAPLKQGDVATRALRDELALVRAFVAVEQRRLGDRAGGVDAADWHAALHRTHGRSDGSGCRVGGAAVFGQGLRAAPAAGDRHRRRHRRRCQLAGGVEVGAGGEDLLTRPAAIA